MKILLALLLFNLSACSSTPKLIYIEPQPFIFQKTIAPKARTIRVIKQDEELYKAYITKFREQINFHNSQIEDYFQSFKNIDEINK